MTCIWDHAQFADINNIASSKLVHFLIPKKINQITKKHTVSFVHFPLYNTSQQHHFVLKNDFPFEYTWFLYHTSFLYNLNSNFKTNDRPSTNCIPGCLRSFFLFFQTDHPFPPFGIFRQKTPQLCLDADSYSLKESNFTSSDCLEIPFHSQNSQWRREKVVVVESYSLIHPSGLNRRRRWPWACPSFTVGWASAIRAWAKWSKSIKSPSLTTSTWTWTASSTSARIPTTTIRTFASPRNRSSPTSFTTSRCYSAWFSRERCSF